MAHLIPEVSNYRRKTDTAVVCLIFYRRLARELKSWLMGNFSFSWEPSNSDEPVSQILHSMESIPAEKIDDIWVGCFVAAIWKERTSHEEHEQEMCGKIMSPPRLDKMKDDCDHRFSKTAMEIFVLCKDQEYFNYMSWGGTPFVVKARKGVTPRVEINDGAADGDSEQFVSDADRVYNCIYGS